MTLAFARISNTESRIIILCVLCAFFALFAVRCSCGVGYGVWVWGTGYCLLFTVHCSLFTVHCLLFPVPCSLFSVHCSLFSVHCSLLPSTESRIITLCVLSYSASFTKDYPIDSSFILTLTSQSWKLRLHYGLCS